MSHSENICMSVPLEYVFSVLFSYVQLSAEKWSFIAEVSKILMALDVLFVLVPFSTILITEDFLVSIVELLFSNSTCLQLKFPKFLFSMCSFT